ncbi:GGDEF domain-containing response regulator [Shewanella colwelliana]|uniref:Diguanylate cyclase response regulator n=1 Tax=Shewanella colwelliana TaxID=23 RepID=A0ABQ4PB99_SHECO|nr:diguanylate cyclase [Shewanella colwelliana]GIU44800.1 diguanylate cyclase response regulator [Shewanella colwelliana]
MEQLPVVLVVDGASEACHSVCQFLTGQYRLLTADTVEQCLIAAMQKPELILLNMALLDDSDISVWQQLKSNPETQNIPVLALVNDDGEGLTMLDSGAADFVCKPIQAVILKARVATHIQLQSQGNKLNFLALHDQLTGLYNRHFLVERAHQSLSKIQRHQTALSIVLLDLDGFRHINDFNGHHVGDLVLQIVSKLLQESFRKEDVVARMGGEEFVILMESGIEEVLDKTESVRQLLQNLKPMGLPLTGSFGVVNVNADNLDFSHLMLLADEAVYKAKADGRNCIVCYDQGHYLSQTSH